MMNCVLNNRYFNYRIIIYFINYLIITNSLTIPSLPLNHIKYWLRSNRNHFQLLSQLCEKQNYHSIQIEELKNETKPNFDLNDKKMICLELKKVETNCWGYESDNNCNENNIYFQPKCPESSNGWAHNKVQQLSLFYTSADFGYVRDRNQEMKHFCQPISSHKSSEKIVSSLKCAQYMRYCSANNILIDFEMLETIDEPMRYREDVIGSGHIGGWNCVMHQNDLQSEGQHKSPLQSWFTEMENYKVFSDEVKCDVWIEKPTFLMKLDATVNMYHHFCDFINLYASLHMNNSFSLDNNIIIWDTYPYRSNFGIVWNAFTVNPILNLGLFKGKKVCFRNAIFPLLPRMIYGIYYNMPLIPGCHSSGLFHAFNRHLIHRLNIETIAPNNENFVRITLISRQTKYRKILNEDELLTTLRLNLKDISVESHDFNHRMSFYDQMSITSNTDILIGMHGAGLTHCLLQPDWAVLFELYNCDDEHCYKDLARLRGVHYMTWTDSSKIFPETTDYKADNPKYSANAKFTNYRFDVKEFLRLVTIAVNYVRNQRNSINSVNNDESFETIDSEQFKTEL